ncbi:hypothetical protein BDZ88DRAFT_431915 [Geranomyces variabilis]|nr:hypothetical protein BDZ88DRAFT_431915 [Geranomyces variabilis]KAJ3142739.1 hypothetical protein HDU90_002610 [Geranomyces variabilis]
MDADVEKGLPRLERGVSTEKLTDRFHVPLAVMLLVTTLIVAAAIAIPIAILSYNGAAETVNQIVETLRNNYVRQVQDRIAATTNIVYQGVQNNADNLAIRGVLDNLNGNPSPYFLNYPDLLFSYIKSIERSDFVIAAGFAFLGSRTAITAFPVNSTSGCCVANASEPLYGRTCVFWTATSMNVRTLNFTVTPPTEKYGVPMPDFPDSTIGRWTDVIRWTIVNKTIPTFQGKYGYRWQQWVGYPLGTRNPDPTVRALGYQVMQVGIQKFSELLRGISTTQNTVIAIWIQSSGELIATNGAFEVLNLTSINEAIPKSYATKNYPNAYMQSAVAKLLTKYGNYSLIPASTSDTFDGMNGRLFVETRAISDEYGLSWTGMVVIPGNDLLGSIQESRRRVIITAVLVAVVMIAFAMGTTFLITLPLRVLTKVMGQATNMNFSAVKNGIFKQPSRIRELAIMQLVFGKMLTRFAEAIEANKRLMHGPGFSSPPHSDKNKVCERASG